MKNKSITKIFIIVFCIILMVSGCSKDLMIVHDENIIKETAIINTELYSYFVTIPISTNKKIENLSLVELQGAVDSIIESEIDFNKDNYQKYKGNYIYSLTLNIKYDSKEKIEINKLKLKLNDEEVVYNIGNVVITDEYNDKRNHEDIVFLNSPLTGYEFTKYAWEAEVKSNIKITKFYLSSSDVEIGSLSINGSVISDNMQIDKTYANEKLNIEVDVKLKNQDFQNSIVGFDLVIEYIDLENNEERIATTPAIFRIYACGEDYTKLYD